MKLTSKGLIDSETSINSNSKRFAKYLTDNMKLYEDIIPSFKQLKELMLLYVIVKWSIQASNNSLDLNKYWLKEKKELFGKQFKEKKYFSDNAIPVLRRSDITNTYSTSDSTSTTTHIETRTIQGGVSFKINEWI